MESRRASAAPGKKRLLASVAAAAICGGTAALVLASTSGMSGYRDDSYGALHTAAKVVALHGNQGITRVDFTPPAGVSGAVLDARDAVFTVSNSRNPDPTAAQDCDQGQQAVNRYPLVVARQDRTAVVGGLFVGRVPQSSDWSVTYCNSAAVTFQEAPNGIVDGVRITSAWDAIRAGRDSPNLLVVNSWITNARDDAVEDDFLQPATIRDTLIDGAFQGISVKPRKDSPAGDASDKEVTLSGILLHLREYPYKGEHRFGALMKSDPRAPSVRMVNSIVAVDYAGGRSYPQYWATSWSKLSRSSHNLFLWLSDAPIPESVAPPPSSFQVLSGRAARDAWERAKTNWINCHPKIARLATDPPSNAGACIPGTWGGYTE